MGLIGGPIIGFWTADIRGSARLGRCSTPAEAKNKEAPGQAIVSNFLVKSLIVQVLPECENDYLPFTVEHSASADPRTARVLAFMRERFADRIAAERLAVASGTSRSSFSRLFGEAVGQSAYQHLTPLRLEHALQLLEQTTRSVSEIVFDCGFGKPAHFTTAFANALGSAHVHEGMRTPRSSVRQAEVSADRLLRSAPRTRQSKATDTTIRLPSVAHRSLSARNSWSSMATSWRRSALAARMADSLRPVPP